MTKRMDVKSDVLFADFNWANILDLLKEEEIAYQDIPKFPEVTRDFALLLDQGTSFQQVYDIAWQTEKKLT